MIKNKNSTTQIDEQRREHSQGLGKSYFKTRSKFGVVKEVHPKFYAAIVLLDEGGDANGGEFVPIKNPWQQLIHDFGPLRVGLRVELTYEGDQENHAVATVISLEGEPLAQNQERADIDLSLYEIFVPGI